MREALQKNLLDILTNIPTIPTIPTHQDCPITGLSCDSRTLQPGNLFFAYPGTTSDGRNYIQTALQKNIAAILIEDDAQREQSYDTPTPIIPIKNLKSKISTIASNYYNNPSAKLNITAITGTNGKSSIAYMLQQCLLDTNSKNSNRNDRHTRIRHTKKNYKPAHSRHPMRSNYKLYLRITSTKASLTSSWKHLHTH